MKRILTTMCALTLLLAASVPALAAEPEQSASYYPTSVEEYMEGDSSRIKKVYQLSLADDPSKIPTEDFERDGRLYYLLDMTRKDEVGVDIQTITQTKTLASETNNMEKILQSLEPQMEVTTEDGYTGTLTLDHTTVKVAADGYATRTKDLSATRTYPNLSEADVSLIPKSIEDNGKSLTLADVQWAETSEAGADGAVTRYTATAKYTGTTSSTYATGYTVTADYTGQVSKTNCSVLTYTAIWGSMEIPAEQTDPAPTDTPSSENSNGAMADIDIKQPLLIGGAILLLTAGGVFLFKRYKGRS